MADFLPVRALSEERVFNDDLLINPGDLRYAQDQFPEIFPVLDHAELRDGFVKYEQIANKAHLWVHWLGLLAVIFATIALLSAATEPLWARTRWADTITIAFEFCGLFATVLTGGSLWLGPWRKRWLESRFMTERLRSKSKLMKTRFFMLHTPFQLKKFGHLRSRASARTLPNVTKGNRLMPTLRRTTSVRRVRRQLVCGHGLCLFYNS